jgi:hypothetical protein
VSDDEGNIVESGPIDLSASGTMEVIGSVVSGNATLGDQTIAFADAEIEIRVATAAHRREMERREMEENFKDRHWQRVRDNCTFAVVVVAIVLGLAVSYAVAVRSDDPSLKTWAQGLTTTIAGVVGGAFAGYLIGSKK